MLLILGFSTFNHASDSTPIDTLVRLIENQQYEAGMNLIDSLLSDSTLKNSRKLNNQLIQKKADLLYYLNDIEQSLEYYLMAARQEELRSDRNLTLISESYGNAAYCLFYLGLFEETIYYGSQAYQYAYESGDSLEMASSTANIGLAHKRLGNYNEALIHLDEAYHLDKALNDSIGMAYDLYTIAAFFQEWGKFDQALKYYQESLVIMTNANRKKEMSARYANISALYLEKGDLIQAGRNATKAIILAKEINDNLSYAKRIDLLGIILLKNKKSNEALINFHEALVIYSEFKALNLISLAHNHLAKGYFALNDYQLAFTHLDSAIMIAEDNDYFQDLVKHYELKINYLNIAGNASETPTLDNKVRILKASMYSVENSNRLHKLELVNELGRKDVEMSKMANTAIKKSNNLKSDHQTMLIWIAIVSMMILVITFLVIRRVQAKKYELYQQEITVLQNKINALLQSDPDSFNIKLVDLNGALEQSLTEREFEILKFTFTKKSNTEIAKELDVSVNTIKFHFKNIFKKTGVKNRKEVLQFLLAA